MKLIFYIFLYLFFPILLTAQIQVSTITDELKGSGGLSLDSEGNLYISDFGDFLSAGDNDGQFNNIMKLDTEGNLTVYATGFVGASGNAFDSQGILYQADIGTSQIYKIIDGQKVLFTASGIVNPVGLVFDENDNLYVCNCGNHTIRKVTPQGVSTNFSSAAALFCPNGITIDENGNLYISNFSDGKVIKITPTGNATTIANMPGGNNGHLKYFEPNSTLYVCSHGASNIYTLTLDGTVTLLAGTGVRGNNDGPADEATFSRPNGIAISPTGDTIYVNTSVPLTNTPNNPLNPELIRMLTNVQGLSTAIIEPSIDSSIEKIELQVVNEQLNISLQSLAKNDFHVVIYDIQGREILRKEWRGILPGENELQIDISSLVTGHYLTTIYSKNKVVRTLKFRK